MKSLTFLVVFCLLALTWTFELQTAHNEGCTYTYSKVPMTQEQCITTCTQTGAPGWCYVSASSCCMCSYDCPCTQCLCPFCGRESFIELGQCENEDFGGFLSN